MKRVYISCLFRLVDADLQSMGELGRVYVLDWDSKKMLNNPRGLDPGNSLYKPTGQSHGARGIAVYKDVLYVASSVDKISKFDLDTYVLIETLQFPEFKGLHQLKVKDGLLYVVSTGNDKRFILEDDKIVDCQDLSCLSTILDDKCYSYTKGWGDGRLHFNSIGWDSNGNEYHVYFQPGVVFNYSKKEIVISDKVGLDCPHDIVFIGGFPVVNSSKSKKTKILKNGNLEVIYSTDYIKPPDKEAENNFWGFTRTLCLTDEGLFVGSVPGNLVLLDINDFHIKEEFSFTTTCYEAIYDIALDHRDWNV